VVGIRYNHQGLHWEYFLRDPDFPPNQRWTHAGRIITRPEDVDYAITNRNKAETWPIHYIRFARGEMVQLENHGNTQREVIGIKFPNPLDAMNWWYTLRRRGSNNRVYITEYHSRDVIPVPVVLDGVEFQQDGRYTTTVDNLQRLGINTGSNLFL
jgi:hypothetical protein